MPSKSSNEKEWTDRDELAARLFEAIITGMMASVKTFDAAGEAHNAYSYADAFLNAREKASQP